MWFVAEDNNLINLNTVKHIELDYNSKYDKYCISYIFDNGDPFIVIYPTFEKAEFAFFNLKHKILKAEK